MILQALSLKFIRCVKIHINLIHKKTHPGQKSMMKELLTDDNALKLVEKATKFQNFNRVFFRFFSH